jgi:hypothetical protein
MFLGGCFEVKEIGKKPKAGHGSARALGVKGKISLSASGGGGPPCFERFWGGALHAGGVPGGREGGVDRGFARAAFSCMNSGRCFLLFSGNFEEISFFA